MANRRGSEYESVHGSNISSSYVSLNSLPDECKAENDNYLPPCEQCMDGTSPAKGYCVTCNNYFCEMCFKEHARYLPCSHHTLIELDNMSADKTQCDVIRKVFREVDDAERMCCQVCSISAYTSVPHEVQVNPNEVIHTIRSLEKEFEVFQRKIRENERAAWSHFFETEKRLKDTICEVRQKDIERMKKVQQVCDKVLELMKNWEIIHMKVPYTQTCTNMFLQLLLRAKSIVGSHMFVKRYKFIPVRNRGGVAGEIVFL